MTDSSPHAIKNGFKWQSHAWRVVRAHGAQNKHNKDAGTQLHTGPYGRPGVLPGVQRRQEGTGDSFRERQRRRVECSQCGKDLAAGSLSVHVQTQHGLTRDGGVGRVDAPGRQPAVFTISFPKVTPTADYPIEGCPGTATSHVNLRRRFMHLHPRDTLVIRDEGSVPLPKCENCGMHVPRSALHSSHPTTAWCRQGRNKRGSATHTRVHGWQEKYISRSAVPLLSLYPCSRILEGRCRQRTTIGRPYTRTFSRRANAGDGLSRVDA